MVFFGLAGISSCHLFLQPLPRTGRWIFSPPGEAPALWQALLPEPLLAFPWDPPRVNSLSPPASPAQRGCKKLPLPPNKCRAAVLPQGAAPCCSSLAPTVLGRGQNQGECGEMWVRDGVSASLLSGGGMGPTALQGEPWGLLPLSHLCPQKWGAGWSHQLQAHYSPSSSSHDLHQAGESVKLHTPFLPRSQGQSCPAVLLTAHPPGVRPAATSLSALLVPLSFLLLHPFPGGFLAQEHTRAFPAGGGTWSHAGGAGAGRWGARVPKGMVRDSGQGQLRPRLGASFVLERASGAAVRGMSDATILMCF